MNRRHLLRAALLTIICGISGCGIMDMMRSDLFMSPPAKPPAQAGVADASKPATQPASNGRSALAEALARQTTSYAKSVDGAMAGRGTASNTPTTSRPATEAAATPVATTSPSPSMVEWLDPRPLMLASPSTPIGPVMITRASPSPLTPTKVEISQVAPPAAPAVLAAARPVMTTDMLEQCLSRRVMDNPHDLGGQLDMQLLQFLRDEQVPQLSQLATLSVEDRELLTTLMDGLSNFRSAVRADSNLLTSRKIRPIIEMADRLRSQAELSVPTVALCTRVVGFGVYQPIEPARFLAGKEVPVILYCEVENFSSQLNDKRLWETRLSQDVVLFTETGLSVWSPKAELPPPDVSRNRRHDYFMFRRLTLPANLTIGRYLLKITVTDQQASRVAEATLPIQIVAQ